MQHLVHKTLPTSRGEDAATTPGPASTRSGALLPLPMVIHSGKLRVGVIDPVWAVPNILASRLHRTRSSSPFWPLKLSHRRFHMCHKVTRLSANDFRNSRMNQSIIVVTAAEQRGQKRHLRRHAGVQSVSGSKISSLGGAAAQQCFMQGEKERCGACHLGDVSIELL